MSPLCAQSVETPMDLSEAGLWSVSQYSLCLTVHLKIYVVIPLHHWLFFNWKSLVTEQKPLLLLTSKIQYKPIEIVVLYSFFTCMLTYATSFSWKQV